MTGAAKITTGQICAVLHRHYAPPRYAILFEVPNGTAWNVQRTADALVMSCWPSMGLELHGLEIKANRHDWIKERNTPEKAEKIAAYCDRWSLVAAPGVVADISEVPQGWGFIECDGKRLKTLREAAKNEQPKPVSRSFLAAIMRRSGKTNDAMLEEAIKARTADEQEKIELRIKDGIDVKTKKHDELVKAVQAFEAETGIKIIERESWYGLTTTDGKRLGAMLNVLMREDGGIFSRWGGGLGAIISQLETAAKRIRRVQEDLGLHEVEKIEPDVEVISTKRRARA